METLNHFILKVGYPLVLIALVIVVIVLLINVLDLLKKIKPLKTDIDSLTGNIKNIGDKVETSSKTFSRYDWSKILLVYGIIHDAKHIHKHYHANWKTSAIDSIKKYGKF